MKDMPDTTCPICIELPHGLLCTLHGGHMTATEVEMRWKFRVVDGRWVKAPAMDLVHPGCEAVLDATYDVLKKQGLVP